MHAALRQGRDADVACRDCCACCSTAHFVHIAPDEADTLAHVPPELLFPAPGHPDGTMLMGYDERGHCPMLRDGLCSIYEHRPRTCRVYDCRVFAAAGIEADRDEITMRSSRWVFRYPGQGDRDEHEAVRAAARFVAGHAALLPADSVPRDPSALAVLAVTTADAFAPVVRAAAEGRTGHDASELSDEQLARRLIEAARRLMVGTVPPDTC